MEPNKESLIKAIGEFDKLGKDSFLNKYSYGENIKYELLYKGKTYPPKAIWGRAYEFLNEGKEALHAIRRVSESLERSPSRFMYKDPKQGVKVP